MPLTPESVQEFSVIYQEEYGMQISSTEAEALATELLSFYQLISPLSPNS